MWLLLLCVHSGTGKTLLARAVASQLDANFLKVVSSAIVDKYIGESARLIREMFGEASFWCVLIFSFSHLIEAHVPRAQTNHSRFHLEKGNEKERVFKRIHNLHIKNQSIPLCT